ncbi:ATP-binding protein [Flavobacterium sp. ZT3P35]|uniref:ATP-binding protein n=3 Tax=unclassified Flavobacterium TaxID=196869 RepID=UPI003AB04D55
MSNNPFNHSHFIGYINQVTPQYVKVHFPSSILMKSFTFYGEELKGGLVGNYVVIEGEKYGFLGKILELSLPEKERLELSEKSFNTKEFHPTGKIEILLSFELFEPSNIDKGLNSLPMIGAKVFICSSQFIKGYFKGFGVKKENLGTAPVIKLGHLTYDKTTIVELSQQAIFGRHCAIVGTTGGGKSYTVSKLLEGIIENKNKAIIIDPTGEYSNFDINTEISCKPLILSNDAFFHYSNLTVSDLFVLLRPSGQVQSPKLMEAIKSLKILRILEKNIDNNFITKPDENTYSIKITEVLWEEIKVSNNNILKAGQLMRPFNRVYSKFINEIEGLNSDFNIEALSFQLMKECINDVDFNNHNKWGGQNNNHATNCISLILRVNNLINNPEFNKIFGFQKQKNDASELISGINEFINGDLKILRIGFEEVSFDFQAREILANAVGKFLLELARKKKFKQNPLVLFVDEAHQFLNKKVKDEYFETTELSSFDSIAKECRKYGLFLCIATQMPRDIPNGTLSQIGTFVAHRLINHQDKEAIANACSSANRDTLAFLPVLGSGEAILMGVDFPMPVMLKVDLPKIKPNSDTPLF